MSTTYNSKLLLGRPVSEVFLEDMKEPLEALGLEWDEDEKAWEDSGYNALSALGYA